MQNQSTSARTAAKYSSKCSLLFRQAPILAILMLCAVLSTKAQCSISGESDTTIVANNKWYGIKTNTRYFFKKENYTEAFKYIQLANIPYNGLNEQAQKELNKLRVFIIREQEIKNAKKVLPKAGHK